MTDRSAIVVGGGLAGMVVSRELRLRGWKVTLLERSKRLGGKAGSDLKNGQLVEHGYHVFPKWYPNIRAILDRINVRLIDFDRYHFLLPGGYPKKVTVLGPSGFRAMFHYVYNGLLPWYHNLLYIYSVLDMLSRPLSDKKALDKVRKDLKAKINLPSAKELSGPWLSKTKPAIERFQKKFPDCYKNFVNLNTQYSRQYPPKE